MSIDLIYAIILLLAIWKGYNRGLIVAVFSVFALVAGLAAALKLSAITALWLKNSVQIGAKWLPVIAFLLVFISVVLLVRIGAAGLEKITSLAWMGWANKLGGMVLYVLLYTLLYSVVLFYMEKINLLSRSSIAASKTYSIISPWGPWITEEIGKLLPVFKNMFRELEDFFSKLPQHVQEA
jgi:membrane protein required for colicin V production